PLAAIEAAAKYIPVRKTQYLAFYVVVVNELIVAIAYFVRIKQVSRSISEPNIAKVLATVLRHKNLTVFLKANNTAPMDIDRYNYRLIDSRSGILEHITNLSIVCAFYRAQRQDSRLHPF